MISVLIANSTAVVVIVVIIAVVASIAAIVFVIKYAQMKKLVGEEGVERLLPIDN